MESIFIDYFHHEVADTIEMSAFQAQHNQFNTMTHLFKYESAFQNKTDFEQDSYWPSYSTMDRSEELWTEVELNKGSYTEEAANLMISPNKTWRQNCTTNIRSNHDR